MTRPKRSNRRGLMPLVSAWLLGVATAVMLLVGVVHADGRATDAEAVAVTYAVQAKQRAQQIAASDVCQSVDPDVVAQFGALCAMAEQVAAQERPDPIDTDALAAQVAAIVTAGLPARIDAAVAAYLADHPPAPGQDATDAMVAAAVAQYLAAHPPAPGMPATAEQVAAEVAAYLERHPPPAGADGATPPCMSEPAQCQGRDGTDGAQGPPGALCPPDQVSEPVIWRDGRAGSRCVVPEGG